MKKLFCDKINKDSTKATKKTFLQKYNPKKYGAIGTGIYLCTTFGGIGFFYLLLKNDIISKENTINYLKSKNYDTDKYINKFGEGKINFALAYLCNFIIKPLRIVFSCVVAAPLSKRKNVKAKSNNGKKSFLKQYGKVGASMYMLYWISTGMIVYYCVVNKYINREKFEKKIENYTMLNNYYSKIRNSLGEKNTDLALAYSINSMLELIRLPTFIIMFRLFAKKK